jgi:hypothetical protein
MAELTLRQQVTSAEDEVIALQHAYLQRFGWKFTCNMPGSFWLWQRDFSDVDARHADWDEKHDAGKPGKPSRHVPYGAINGATTEIAIAMTKNVLDYEIDQDGDSDTPVITEEDLQEA